MGCPFLSEMDIRVRASTAHLKTMRQASRDNGPILLDHLNKGSSSITCTGRYNSHSLFTAVVLNNLRQKQSYLVNSSKLQKHASSAEAKASGFGSLIVTRSLSSYTAVK